MTPAPPDKSFSLPALLTTVGTCIVLLAATGRVLGVPDVSLVGTFTTGARPSHEAALATASLMVWTALLTVCAWLVLRSCAGMPHMVRRSVQSIIDPGTVVLVIGVFLLGMAVVRHLTASPQMCCGSIQEASQNLGR